MSDEETDSYNIVKQPYRSYTLDEDKEESNSSTLNLRINKEEREQIDVLKFIWRYDQDAKIIKLALDVLQNVTHNTLGAATVFKVTDERRKRGLQKYRFEGKEIVKL